MNNFQNLVWGDVESLNGAVDALAKLVTKSAEALNKMEPDTSADQKYYTENLKIAADGLGKILNG